MGWQRHTARWNIWMTAAKWCLTADQLQSSFNCHLHQHGDGWVMEGNLCFCAWWRWRQSGERPTDERNHTHTHVCKGSACVCVSFLIHVKKRTTMSERMRGSWDEDESNTVYTLNTLQTHFHLKHLTLTAACQLRPLFNNSAEGFQQVKLSNSEIKFKRNPPQTCQCCGKSWHALRHWNILKVESALLSLNCVCFDILVIATQIPTFPPSLIITF